ncbi:MAG TPA: hypothetical protein DHW61_03075 [Lachnoclostridium phytofermentans]|uniref:N-acetyltransferase domain-containing protein n=2 Tax=Lachnoclostridium TaxID=1506553 RepID=A0A3D2X2L2_9FIRM|nr:hypothetical protein [Lachnoclostridium phytofermentans]
MSALFFSCIYKGKLRIHIVFTEDTDIYNDQIDILIRESVNISGLIDGKIWICNNNYKITEYLLRNYNMTADSEKFFYESYEMFMPRAKFTNQFDSGLLEVRPYQEDYIDDYLLLLSDSMSFKIPPYDYINSKEHFLNEFKLLKEKNTFEAFWMDDKLVGVYWLAGTEIDHLAVAADYQRSGYGAQILTRAIEVVFQNPDIDCAWLLVVGWNSKAFNFYKKYGLKVKTMYKVPYNNHIN